MSKFYLKIKTAYIKSLLSFYYPTAANTVQITIQIYSDIKLLFVQYKTCVTSQLMWMPPYLSVEDHIRNKIGWTWSQTCLTSWLLVTQSYVLVKDVLLRRSWVRFLSGTQIFSLSHARVMLNDSSFTFHYQAITSACDNNQQCPYLQKYFIHKQHSSFSDVRFGWDKLKYKITSKVTKYYTLGYLLFRFQWLAFCNDLYLKWNNTLSVIFHWQSKTK